MPPAGLTASSGRLHTNQSSHRFTFEQQWTPSSLPPPTPPRRARRRKKSGITCASHCPNSTLARKSRRSRASPPIFASTLRRRACLSRRTRWASASCALTRLCTLQWPRSAARCTSRLCTWAICSVRRVCYVRDSAHCTSVSNVFTYLLTRLIHARAYVRVHAYPHSSPYHDRVALEFLWPVHRPKTRRWHCSAASHQADYHLRVCWICCC